MTTFLLIVLFILYILNLYLADKNGMSRERRKYMTLTSKILDSMPDFTEEEYKKMKDDNDKSDEKSNLITKLVKREGKIEAVNIFLERK